MNRIILLPLFFFCISLNAQFFMYPGDTNNDGVANYIDVLPIGLAYQGEGPPREIPVINWAQQEYFLFGQTLPFSGVDYGFIDCDGNGFIDSLDIEAIYINYESMQSNAFPFPQPYEPSDTLFTTNIPEVSISFEIDTAFVSDTILVAIEILFPGSLAVEPALGLALGLVYDTEFIKDSLTVIYPDTISDDLMFVTAASNYSSFWRLPDEGRMEIGAAGRGQNAISGSRTIATAFIVIEDVIIRSEGEKPFYFELTDVLLLNDQEQILEVNFHSDTLLLIDTVVGLVDLIYPDEVKIYPNPTRDDITIQSKKYPVQEVLFFNQLGQAIRRDLIAERRKFRLPTDSLSVGIYFLQIRTTGGIVVKKMIISN
jgi:type IX secretion system substrate protein